MFPLVGSHQTLEKAVMRHILVTTSIALALGIAPIHAFAQTEMKKKLPEQSEGQGGEQQPQRDQKQAPEGGNIEGQGGVQSEPQGGTKLEGEGTQNQNGTTEQGTEAPMKRGTQNKEDSQKQDESQKQGDGQEQSAPMKSQGEKPAEGEATKKEKPSTEGQTSGSATEKEKTGGETKNVTVEQRTEIKRTLKETHVEPAPNINFSVDVGVRVPREVHLYRLPPRIIKLVPAYEGYEYFLLADGRIVIVDPDTLEIVLIIA